jgi:glycosyltransferase involved in cell wall biosynthesis
VYLDRLVPALVGLGIEVVELANERRGPPAGGGLGSVRNAVEDRWWTAVELPLRAARARADVLHHALPARSLGAPMPQVVTVHDLAFERLPDAFDPRFAAFARSMHRRAVRGAGALVCVSQTTARDAAARWNVPRERMVVAPHGPGQHLEPRPPGEPRHFLYVGDAEPRKNVALLRAAHRAYRERHAGGLPLVLAGLGHTAGEGIVAERPGAERLAELHAGAAALVHPALHEGFGMTALEAMAAGVPVLAARSPGVVETCAGAARYFDPRDPDDLAAALAEQAADGCARDALRARGRARAAGFSWERSARAHVGAYTLALRKA